MAAGEPGSHRAAGWPWWQGFQDPLDRLVEAVLAANPDMRVAGLKLKNALLGADLADTNLTPRSAPISGPAAPRT
jgi:outer membrane protein TolC